MPPGIGVRHHLLHHRRHVDSTVGRWRLIWRNSASGVLRSGNSTHEAPTEKGNSTFDPSAYPKNSFGTDIVMSSAVRPSTPFPYRSVVLTNDRPGCTTAFGWPVVPPLNSQIAASSRCDGNGG